LWIVEDLVVKTGFDMIVGYHLACIKIRPDIIERQSLHHSLINIAAKGIPFASLKI
jgi:hypothetical protein